MSALPESSTRARTRKGVQCSAWIPQEVGEALEAHLALTGVKKQDFVSLALRREIHLQRSKGLGLVNGEVPEGGRALKTEEGEALR